jgi:putative FmdB family regulatory protein
MPIYEYQCGECGYDMEAIQSIKDAPLTECPKCGKPALKKRVSAAAFRLKGGGWYETDFKSGGKRNVVGGESSSSSGSEGASKSAGGEPAASTSAVKSTGTAD